jgi:hypothetical protein
MRVYIWPGSVPPIVSLLLVLLCQGSRADVVTDWNDALRYAARVSSMNPPLFARNTAMTHLAIYDAANALSGNFRAYSTLEKAPVSAPAEPAMAAAAYTITSAIFTNPSARTNFEAVYAKSLQSTPESPEKSRAVEFGRSIGEWYLQLRANDHATNVVPYTAQAVPGVWRPTLPANAAALLPGWGSVTPFALVEAADAVPHRPPTLNSSAYALELNLTKAYGASNSVVRTAEQTEIALFWADGAGTETPPGHWNHIAADLSRAKGLSVLENARLFALLNVALADAGMACWAAKYKYNFWRPITAIREADTDNNADTEADPNWVPLLSTPPFPECTSGHSTFSRSAATVLASYFGSDDIAFTTGSDALPNVKRSFTSFSQAADEAGISRVYGGIHFQTANIAGQACGLSVANHVLHYLFQPAAALEFATISRMNGETSLSARVKPKTLYSIRASSDLNTWEEIGAASCDDGLLQFTDPNAPSGRLRFYRMQAKP